MNENQYILKEGSWVDMSGNCVNLYLIPTYAEVEESYLEFDMESNSLSELLMYYSESFTRAYGKDVITYLRIIIKLMDEKIKLDHCQ